MKEKLETSIFVDGDACPVKDEILKVAYRHKVPVFIVSNQWMRIEVGPLVKKVVVSAGPDEADDWIADRVGQNDIAITADIPLAKRCLEAGAIVLGMTGRLFSSDNIGMVPLGTPLLAGPGAIVATMIYVQKADTNAQILGLVIAILAVHLIIGTVLMASTKIVGLIKDSGVTLLASIAGLLLAAIAVQMLANAIKTFAAS